MALMAGHECPCHERTVGSMVEQQGARVPTEWLLVLCSLLRGCPGSSGDLGIARGLVHADIGGGDRCQSDRGRRGGDRQ